ncbi:Aste57867_21873 [Aphanomyces stellatus]|uniref:Aste57867_21873 protein n=1 Tax=Aphanomyces stellatus TaxID=120398 RepID=A0A485LK15_9STRA|nr:hypothetical protein As57867_021804 [Aphanomyces stellatus]VFT98541.1 Aste57867_21873 [Aphanomyces stellatus]
MCLKSTVTIAAQEPEEPAEEPAVQHSPFLAACVDGEMTRVRALVNDAELNRGLVVTDVLEVIEFLLSLPGVDVNFENHDGLTPFIFASACGNIAVVSRLLLETKLDVNYQSENGVTALMVASSMGHLEVVKLLLEQPELDSSMVNAHGTSSFAMACREGHMDIVSVFLTHHDDVETRGAFVHDGFVAACKMDQLEIVQMLFKLDEMTVDQLSTGFYDACVEGRAVVAAYLLDHADVNVNKTNTELDQDDLELFPNGLGVFCAACSENYVDIVSLLIQHPHFDTTQLSLGLSMTHNMDIVELILAHPATDVNAIGVSTITPLVYACTEGTADKVERFLQVPQLDVNAILEDDTFALMMACSSGFLDIVKLLLDDPRTDIALLNSDDATAFGVACLAGHTDVVQLLLDHPKMDFEIFVDGLIMAYNGEREDVVIHLLAHGCFDLNQEFESGHTLFFDACESNSTTLVELLLNTPSIDSTRCIKAGVTPFVGACASNASGVVALLLKSTPVDINAVDVLGETALLAAAGNGSTKVVALLLAQPTVDVNYQNPDGYTPLMIACIGGYAHTVALLLKYPFIDVNLKNKALVNLK